MTEQTLLEVPLLITGLFIISACKFRFDIKFEAFDTLAIVKMTDIGRIHVSVYAGAQEEFYLSENLTNTFTLF